MGVRVQIIGVRPIASEMARTRSSRRHWVHIKCQLRVLHLPISPKGGRIVVGVTPRTFLIAFRVQPNSATICSVVREVKCWKSEVSICHAFILLKTHTMTPVNYIQQWECDLAKIPNSVYHVCTEISWPVMYCSRRTSGRSMTREPTTKNVARIFFMER